MRDVETPSAPKRSSLVFNILIDNTDDHEKKHAAIVTDAQQYALSPSTLLYLTKSLNYEL